MSFNKVLNILAIFFIGINIPSYGWEQPRKDNVYAIAVFRESTLIVTFSNTELEIKQFGLTTYTDILDNILKHTNGDTVNSTFGVLIDNYVNNGASGSPYPRDDILLNLLTLRGNASEHTLFIKKTEGTELLERELSSAIPPLYFVGKVRDTISDGSPIDIRALQDIAITDDTLKFAGRISLKLCKEYNSRYEGLLESYLRYSNDFEDSVYKSIKSLLDKAREERRGYRAIKQALIDETKIYTKPRTRMSVLDNYIEELNQIIENSSDKSPKQYYDLYVKDTVRNAFLELQKNVSKISKDRKLTLKKINNLTQQKVYASIDALFSVIDQFYSKIDQNLMTEFTKGLKETFKLDQGYQNKGAYVQWSISGNLETKVKKAVSGLSQKLGMEFISKLNTVKRQSRNWTIQSAKSAFSERSSLVSQLNRQNEELDEALKELVSNIPEVTGDLTLECKSYILGYVHFLRFSFGQTFM